MIDFLVIGGGIAGLSAAARLSELGHCHVLERETATGYHASGRSAAMFEETYGSPSTIALNQASKHWHLEVAGAKNTPRGLMLLGHAGNADILRGHGGSVVTGATVSDIRRTADGWAVTAGETYQAKVIVNAAGAWADQIAVMAGLQPLGLQPYRRSMARIPAPGGHDVSDWPMLFGPGETWYAKPDAGALLISPADEDPCAPMDAWADDMVLATGIAHFQDHVTTPVTRMLSNWAGLRTFSPDRGLCLGPSEVTGFWWCAGQGGYGFQTAPAASQLLADLVGGRPPQIDPQAVAALSPARFAKTSRGA